MKNKKLYKIYYGDNENEYIIRYLKENDVINGYLSESKAFELFYDNMIISNNYLENNYDNLEILINSYDYNEDYYIDEYQVFIIDSNFSENVLIKATEKMGNTLYYDFKNELYLTGITDLGMSRKLVPTDLKIKEVKDE